MKKDLKIIFTHDGIKLQYDKNNNLYVNGNRLLTKKKIALRGYELILATLSTIAIVAPPAVSLIKYLSAY